MQDYGRYQLIEPVAHGGMAEIFLARQHGPGGFSRELVIKRVLPEYAGMPRFVEMFFDEAKVIARLSHPNIVTIIDFGEVDGSYYIAMERVLGPSLSSLGRAAARQQRTLPFAILARICAQVAEGLAYAHRLCDEQGQPLGIVHRDISPSNIVVSYDGVPKILDFGIAKASTSTHKTRTGEIRGKLAYMPPEQVTGEPLDGRADVYALGVVLYQCATNRKPFVGKSDYALMSAILQASPEPPHVVNPAIPLELARIILRAMASRREDRHQSARELAQELDAFVLAQGAPISSFDIGEVVRGVEEAHGECLTPAGLFGTSRSFSAHPGAAAPAEGAPVAPVEGEPADATPIAALPAEQPTISSGERAAAPAALASPSVPDPGPEAERQRAPTVPMPRVGGVVQVLHEVPAAAATPPAPQAPRAATVEPSPVGSASRRPLRTAAIGAALLAAAIAGWLVVSAQGDATGEVAVDAGRAPQEPAAAQVAGVTPPPTADAAQATDAVAATPLPPVVARAPHTKPRKPAPDAGPRAAAAGPAAPAAPGSLMVHTTPWTRLDVDGVDRGDTPLRVELAAGTHQLELRNAQAGIVHRQVVTVQSGQETKLRLDFTPGEIVLVVKPWGEVYVDGVKRGTTPLPPFQLAPGSHRIEVVHPDSGRRQSQTVDVKPGSRVPLKFDLSGP